MRKLNFTILLTMLMAVGTLLNAQDTIRHLLITETRFDTWTYAYTELTNMSETETVDLSEFLYGILRDNQPSFHLEDDVVYLDEGYELWETSHMRLHGMLGPGESYMLMAVQDAINGEQIYPRIVQSLDLLERVDTVVHFFDWGSGDDRYESRPLIPEWEMWGFDSTSVNTSVVFNRHNDAPSLYWTSGDTITVLVDQALGTINWGEGGTSGNYINDTDPPKSVAGVPSAHDDYTLIRKFSIKEGETNWAIAAGSDPITSSWMLIPSNKDFNRMAWETEGVHGDFHLDYSSTVYDIDESANTITVPWGTEKYDSIRLGLDLGPGMAWSYIEHPSFDDSLSTVCQNGDTLMLYSAGTELETKALQIIVAEPAGDMVSAFPRKAINYPDPEADDYMPYHVPIVGGVVYGYTQGLAQDSIFEIAFATPIDTLFKLLEIAPNATYEFIWASGVESAEVSYGDILKITGGDGTTTKEYFMAVAPLEESDNVDLKSLTWPDIPDDSYYIGQGWKSDTVPSFTPNGTTYGINLRPGTSTVPALVVKTDDVNATYKVTRAKTLKGGVDDRTTVIEITSESDTTTRTIKVTFAVFNPDLQKYKSDPVFSKFIIRDWWNAAGMEILNPSDELIDLSKYMIVKTDETSPADAIIAGYEPDSASWLNRWTKMIPGMKWETFDGWAIEPGKLITDNAIDPFMDPKDVKVFWKMHNDAPDWKSYRNQIDPAVGGRADYIINNNDDFSFSQGIHYNPWGEPLNHENTIAFPDYARGAESENNMFIFKILNDSVRAGTKLPMDPEDFEVVDTWGHPIAPWVVNGFTWPSSPNESWATYRKPDKYKGSTELGSNFGDSATSHYTITQDYEGTPARRTVNQMDMGFFNIDPPISEHISTVASLVYKVSRGWEGDQTIDGVSSAETVADFFGNVTPGSPDQILVVTNGGEKATDAAIVTGDSLLVTAGDGTVTLYLISTSPLDGDNVLVAVAGSGLVVETGDPGSVSGFDFGTTLRAVLDNLTVPALAVLNVVDPGGNLVPLQVLNNDTMYVDLVASATYMLEVVAENGDIAVYDLMPTMSASDAYVLSDIYVVAEEPGKTISSIGEGTTVSAFLANLVPVEGATLKVYIKTGQERTSGNLNFDDVLEVTSGDGTVKVVYSLNFVTELSAYVTSETFEVTEEELMISVPENTTVESLVDGLVPAPEAMIMVYDVDMNEKTTGTVLDTDMVKVVSGDQRVSVTYTITVITSVYTPSMDQLQVYPNPASDILFVKNIPADTYVRVSDITGRLQVLTQAGDISSGLDLSGMKDGLYFLSIEKDGKILTTVKFIKK